MDVRASIVSELNGPWHTETIEIDEPHANEVTVKVAFSGSAIQMSISEPAHSARTGDPGVVSGAPPCTRSSAATRFRRRRRRRRRRDVGQGGRPRGDVVHPLVWEVRILRLRSAVHLRHGAGTLAGPMISDGTWRHHLGDTNLNRMCNWERSAEYVVAHEASVIRIEPWYDLRAAALSPVASRPASVPPSTGAR